MLEIGFPAKRVGPPGDREELVHLLPALDGQLDHVDLAAGGGELRVRLGALEPLDEVVVPLGRLDVGPVRGLVLIAPHDPVVQHGLAGGLDGIVLLGLRGRQVGRAQVLTDGREVEQLAGGPHEPLHLLPVLLGPLDALDVPVELAVLDCEELVVVGDQAVVPVVPEEFHALRRHDAAEPGLLVDQVPVDRVRPHEPEDHLVIDEAAEDEGRLVLLRRPGQGHLAPGVPVGVGDRLGAHAIDDRGDALLVEGFDRGELLDALGFEVLDLGVDRLDGAVIRIRLFQELVKSNLPTVAFMRFQPTIKGPLLLAFWNIPTTG